MIGSGSSSQRAIRSPLLLLILSFLILIFTDFHSRQRSRQTRHQDAASRSRQGHVIDLDPTDGLPVQRWGLMKVTINQDASTESSSTNPKSTSSAEWAAQFNTEQHPWPERPLPSYFPQLSSYNQEMIRRARAGNTNPTISSYDRKAQSWTSGADLERKATATKLNSLNTTDPTEKPRNGNNDADSSKSGDDSGAEDSSNEYNKSADEDEFDGDETTPFKPSHKRRKVTSRHNGPDDTRSFQVRKWVPLPPSLADKPVDRTCLAPRRPGLPPLYNNPEYAMKLFGQYHSSASLTGTSGYDLGEGGGLSNASGVLAAGTTNDTGVATPRKNVPPRRKKKKLGGPGRKKANPNPAPTDLGNAQVSAAAGSAGQGTGADAMEGVMSGDGQMGDPSGNTTRNPGDDGAAQDDDNENDNDNDNDNDSGSEAEGSEEGEIDESGGVDSKSAQISEIPPPPTTTTAVTVTPPTAPAAPTPATTIHTEVTLPTKLEPEPEPEPEPKPEPKPEPIDEAQSAVLSLSTTTTDPNTLAAAAADASPSPPLPNPIVTITDTSIDNKDPEETAIIEENAQAITDTTTTTTTTTTTQKTGEDAAGAGATEEIDFLGGLDAAIDEGMSEGA